MCLYCDWKSAVERIGSILGDVDRIPEEGSDYAESVRETLEDMQAGIEDRKHVTDNQLTAIDNMENGVNGWLK